MDISYLLALQGIRERLGDGISALMAHVSDAPVGLVALLLPAILYWCVDKDSGLYLLANFGLGRALNLAVKNTACVPRPWARDARVVPYPGALPGATGYSFPSGHTQRAVSVYGGLAALLLVPGMQKRRKDGLQTASERSGAKDSRRAEEAAWNPLRILQDHPSVRNVLAGLCVLLALLVGFSRNYLGVHTPQDVLAAALEAVLVLLLTRFLFSWILEKESRARLSFVGGIALSALLVAYLLAKPDPSGASLMRLDAFDGAGYLAGLSLGWYLERTFVQMRMPSSLRECGMRLLAGTMALLALKVFLLPAVRPLLDARVYKFLSGFCPFLLILLGMPWLFTRMRRFWGGSV